MVELNEYVHIDYCQRKCHTEKPIGIVQSATFGWPVAGYLSLGHFSEDFNDSKCYIKGNGLGSKVYVPELFTVVGY